MRIERRKTRVVKIGKVKIGGNFPIPIQSMTKTKTSDIKKTVRQIKDLEKTNCKIVRLAVKDEADCLALKQIKKHSRLPLVADIHFNWHFAIKAIKSGVDKIRLNPGNIYKKDEIREIVKEAKSARIPIRIGVNSGSLYIAGEKNQKKLSIVDKMVKNALDYIQIIEGLKFYDLVISLKASNVLDTVEAYRKISKLCDYPLHLGVTATGLPEEGKIKSSIAVGSLLLSGIGDTVRVSLTGSPEEEVFAAQVILASLGLGKFGPEIISCPTCGRCEVDLIHLVKNLEKVILRKNFRDPIKIALMGCVVNGPGEASEANIGVAFGKNSGLMFKNGKPVKKVNLKNFQNVLLKEMEKLNG